MDLALFKKGNFVIKIKNKQIYLVVLLALLFQTAYQGNIVLTTLYAVHLHAHSAFLGVIVALSAVFPMLLAIYSGKFTDRIGFKLPLVLGMIGCGSALLLPFIVHNQLWILLVSQSLFGLFQIFTIVTIQNLVGALSNSKNYSKNYAILSQGTSIGELLGNVMTGFAIDHIGYSFTYVFLASLAIISGLVFLFNLVTVPKYEKKTQVQSEKFIDLLASRNLRKTFITSGIILTGVFLFSFYFPVYGRSIHLSTSLIGLILGANTAAYFIIRLVMPRLSAKLSEMHLLGICLLMSSIGFALIPLVKNFYILAGLSFVMGLGLGCCQPLSMSMAYHFSPKNRTGEVLGLRLAVNKFAQVAVPIISVPLGGTLGTLPVFWTNAALFIYGGLSMFTPETPDKIKSEISEKTP